MRPRTFFDDVVAVFATRVGVIGLKFLATIVLARALGPEQRGLLAALTVIPVLVASLCDLGVRQAAAHYIGKGKSSAESVASALLLLFVGTAALGLIVCLAYFRLAGPPQTTPTLAVLAALAIPLTIFSAYASGVFLGLGQIVRYNRVGWVPEVIRLLFLLGAAATVGLTVERALIAMIAGALFSCAYAAFLVSRMVPVRIRFEPALMRSILSMGAAFAFALFLLNLNYKLNTVVLQHRSTLAEIGWFTQAVVLAELVWQIPSTLSSLVFSRSATARDEVEFSRKVAILMRLTLIASAAAAVGIAAASPVLVPLLFGREFEAAVPMVLMLMPGIVAMSVFKILNLDLGAGRGKPWLAAVIVFPSLVLNLVLSWFLSPAWGGVGAAAASSASYLAITAGYIAVYSRTVRVSVFDLVTPRLSDMAFLLNSVPALRRFSRRATGR